MAWYAVYDVETGALLSVGDVVGESLPDTLGVVEVEVEDQPLPYNWDPATKAFRPDTPPAPVDKGQ